MAEEGRIIIACPNCNTHYRVRVSYLNKLARCAKCRKSFYLTPSEYYSDEEIVGWLTSIGDEDDDVMNATMMGLSVLEKKEKKEATGEARTVSDLSRALKLAYIDERGAHFVFPSGLLYSEDFRASFPAVCANCLTRERLRIYLVKWMDKKSIPKGFGSGKLLHYVGNLGELPVSAPREIIKYLAPVEGLPQPFSLPFPYYVCDRCIPEKLILGLYSLKEEGQCLLRIKNIDLACQFYENACGSDTEEYRRLCESSRLVKIDGWKGLSEEVKRRLGKWFTPQHDERFLAYIPDILPTGKAASGESGIVITNKRLVCYCKEQFWREFNYSGRITVSWKASGPHRVKVDIAEVSSGRISFLLDDRSWVNFKHLLAKAYNNVKFVEV